MFCDMHYTQVWVCMTWLWRVEQWYYDNDDVRGGGSGGGYWGCTGYNKRVLFFWLCYVCIFSFVGLQYGDWYSGRWGVDCYIWYSEEGTGRCGESFEMIASCDREEGWVLRNSRLCETQWQTMGKSSTRTVRK